jgi:hypothetical protein
MRLQLLSDLHLETDPSYPPVALPDIDLLVLAGDVGSQQTGSQLPADDAFGLRRFSPRLGGPWRRVLYVPGNHEYDDRPYTATRATLRAQCAALGIDCLDEAETVIDGVRFIGCTLWSDFDALALAKAAAPPKAGPLQRKGRPAPIARPAQPEDSPLTRLLHERGRALRAADWWLRQHTTLADDGTPMLAEALRELGLREQAWLRAALARPHPDSGMNGMNGAGGVGDVHGPAGPTVVITHFAPSLRCADPRYGLAPGTAGFCNALDDLLPMADLWLHGHLHCPIDFVAEGPRADGSPGRCRVVANPLGYARKNEREGHRPGLVIEVPGRARTQA